MKHFFIKATIGENILQLFIIEVQTILFRGFSDENFSNFTIFKIFFVYSGDVMGNS